MTALKNMTIAQLKEFLADDYEVDDLKGLRKQELYDLAVELETERAGEAQDEEEDDEVDDMTLDEVADAIERAQDDEVDDEVDDDEEEDSEPVDTLTAKQVATRLGTDAKNLRKFFRSKASTVEPVGQGGRYEFNASDFGKIKAEFDAWNSTKRTRTPGTGRTKTKDAARERQAQVEEVEVEELELDDEEPDEDELDDIEDIELDDDDLELDS